MVVFWEARLIMNGLPTKKDDIIRHSICELASQASARLWFVGSGLRVERLKWSTGMIIDGQSLNQQNAMFLL